MTQNKSKMRRNKSKKMKQNKSKMKQNKLDDLDNNGYYNRTVHTCVLKLHLPLEIINDIYKNLHNKNEVSGVFYVDEEDKVTHADKNEGDTGSVYTPNNVINYHTHPINAYREGKTALGCHSGEDVRETIKFAMGGNKAHIVFTVEGLYVIQVSPCKLKKIKELLNDKERGILIFAIEEYFKTIHDFRCVDELNELNANGICITPYSFVDFTNTFDIPNLLSDKKMVYRECQKIPINKVGHTSINSDNNCKLYTRLDPKTTFSKIPNVGFPEINFDHVVTNPISKFISTSDFDDLRSIDINGIESEFPGKITIQEITKVLGEIAKKFNSAPCNIEWNNKPNTWFFVNFFPTQHYISEAHKKNNKYIMPQKETNELYLPHEPFIRIFSNSKTGCKITRIAKTHNFNMKRRFHYFGANCKSSKKTFGFGGTSVMSDIRYLTKINLV